MLVIILSWICIILLAYPTGVGIHAIIGSMTKSPAAVHMHFSLKCLTGLMGITFISVLCCLFIPLGLVSNLLDVAIAGGLAFLFRDEFRISLHADRDRLRQMYWVPGLLFVLFIFILAYLSYLPSSHHDDGLYYSTSIKWLEEFGTVKGIANINPRIGFDSTWHILQANFGFQYFSWGLFNDINGLIFLLVLLYSVGGIHDLLQGKSKFSSGLRALFMLPILAFHFDATSDVMPFNVNFISSSSSDIPACLLVFMVFLLFIEGESNMEGGVAPSDVLVVLYSIWVCSIKLSSIPILLISCWIIFRLIRRGYFRLLAFLSLGGVLFVLPWLVRNVLISGYLLFPVSAIDLFHVSWKIPERDIKWHENAVKAFILSTDINHPFDTPFTKWFPKWLSGLDFIRQVIMAIVALATLSYIFSGSWMLLRQGWSWFVRHQRKAIYVAIGAIGILFWLEQAPDFRFGYGFLLFYCIFFLTVLFYYFLEGYYRGIAGPVILYITILVFVYYKSTWTSIQPYFAGPLPYRMPSEIHKVALASGGEIYVVNHDDSWNAPLPVANANELGGLKPSYLGATVKEGFRSNEK